MKKPNKKYKVYKLTDLKEDDIYALSKALNAPPKAFICHGNNWRKFHSLELIDDDTRVTPHGIDVIAAFQRYMLN